MRACHGKLAFCCVRGPQVNNYVCRSFCQMISGRCDPQMLSGCTAPHTLRLIVSQAYPKLAPARICNVRRRAALIVALVRIGDDGFLCQR